ncbi:class I SAM-dependent methyltransferase [Methylopila sp. M107]|uniref:class I SAM-dependent methyltransferase n=1 Tax=Methylopila sp. M107 TaxID=1101190 RepID=UPI0003746A0A|nr:class I SAM-dependent methyltransferase [Methylopila sp. M107]
MSAAEFDAWRDGYEQAVDQSISFSGLRHDFFLAAKADLLEEIAAERLTGARAARVLDVGCGVGRLHPHLRGRFRSIAGCDVSAESIDRARIENPDLSYAVSEAGRLPYDDGAFDIATASCVMHHVPPAEWPAFAAELRRVTRPGGLAVVIEHNPWNPLTRLAVARCPFDKDAVLLAAGTTKRLLAGAGFSETSACHFLLVPSARPLARKIERLFSSAPLGAQYAAIGAA